MKFKQKTPLLILIPMIAVFIVVGAAVAIKLLSPENAMPTKAADESVRRYPNLLQRDEGKKPSSFMGRFLGGNPTPTPTPATADDLSRELKNTVDDGGAMDFDKLEQEAAAL